MTTLVQAWICLIQAICRGIKLGYTTEDGEEEIGGQDEQIQEFQVRFLDSKWYISEYMEAK